VCWDDYLNYRSNQPAGIGAFLSGMNPLRLRNELAEAKLQRAFSALWIVASDAQQ